MDDYLMMEAEEIKQDLELDQIHSDFDDAEMEDFDRHANSIVRFGAGTKQQIKTDYMSSWKDFEMSKQYTNINLKLTQEPNLDTSSIDVDLYENQEEMKRLEV